MRKKLKHYVEGTVELIEYSNCYLLAFTEHETKQTTTIKVTLQEGQWFKTRTGVEPIEKLNRSNTDEGL